MKHKLLILILFFSYCLNENSFAFTSKSIPNTANQYEMLQKAIEHYQKLKETETWAPLTLSGQTELKLSDHSPIVKEIKHRLELLGDIKALNNTEVFNHRMEIAIRNFQARHGLEETGTVNADLIKMLNVPLDTRINQMRINMERLQKEKTGNTGRRIVANIPEYKLHVYEDDNEILSMDVVVGKTTNKTAVFSDVMNQIVFSPYWNVPASIVREEILPAMKRNKAYLRNNNMEIIGTKDGLPEIRQKPGPKNSLGKVKFLFPNAYNIYFHDTPAKALFARKTRAFSHGCIRLSQPLELAKYLLKDNPKWTDDAIMRAMNSGAETWVKLDQPVPISISYYTAWVDVSGDVHFRDDIYGKDKELVNAGN
ncbi:MAG: L,D-transpeptidase family protein [Pyrinomonadaceae bacterium]|nr:L,D-transpeptidase family protein [Sphingobacteriaceae bacterium]